MTAEGRTSTSLWFFALDGEELAGFSVCRKDTNDPVAGHVELLGVRRPWRKPGSARRSSYTPFRPFGSGGWTRGTLGVDASSPTGATRLYERAGMSVDRDTLFLDGPRGAGFERVAPPRPLP